MKFSGNGGSFNVDFDNVTVCALPTVKWASKFGFMAIWKRAYLQKYSV